MISAVESTCPPRPAGRQLLAALCAAFLAIVLTSCGGLGEKEEAALERARLALDESRYANALVDFDVVLETNPEHAPSRLGRAEALLETGDSSTALAEVDAVIASGDLDVRGESHARYVRGRSLIETGRKLLGDTAFRTRGATHDVARRARERFMAANVALRRSTELDPSRYEPVLWRAYALYRQENFRRALELLQSCAKLAENDWRHAFFQALAWDGLQGLNSQAVSQVLDVALENPRVETTPVVVFLIDIHDEVPEETARRIERIVAAFAEETASKDAAITSFLARAEKSKIERANAAELDRSIEDAKRLAAADKYEEALARLEDFRKRGFTSAELDKYYAELGERWSRVLEVQTADYLRRGTVGDLEKARASYERANKLTADLDRQITLTKKLSMVDGLLAQHNYADRLRAARERLDAKDVSAALELLDLLPEASLSEANRDMCFYLRGRAHFEKKAWQQASQAFARVSPAGLRALPRLELWRGWSLVRSGRTVEGVRAFEKTREVDRDDAVERLIAEQHVRDKRFADALACLGRVEEAEPADVGLEARCRHHLGVALFQSREYKRAMRELRAADELYSEQLQKPSAETVAFLGRALHRNGDVEAAREAFERFVFLDPGPEVERRFRDIFLTLARARLAARDRRGGYDALETYRRQGGTLPADIASQFVRLAATFRDFLPFERVAFWRYEKATPDGRESFDVIVRGRSEDRYLIERREGSVTLEEEWSRDGVYLVRKSGQAVFRVPLSLTIEDSEPPHVEFEKDGQRYQASVVSFDTVVKLDEKREYRGCLRVDTLREIPVPDGKPRTIRQRIWLAPDVGEVKRQVLEGQNLVCEVTLSEVRRREAPLE